MSTTGFGDKIIIFSNKKLMYIFLSVPGSGDRYVERELSKPSNDLLRVNEDKINWRNSQTVFRFSF